MFISAAVWAAPSLFFLPCCILGKTEFILKVYFTEVYTDKGTNTIYIGMITVYKFTNEGIVIQTLQPPFHPAIIFSSVLPLNSMADKGWFIICNCI